MANTTKTQVPNVNAFYNRTLLERAVANFVFNKWAQVRDIPKGNSDVIKFRKYGSLAPATTPLTEGVTPSGKQLSITDTSATVQQYGDFVALTDKLKMETEDPIETETTEVLGEQAAETLDTLARDILVAGTNIQYADTATSRVTVTAGMTLTEAEIKEHVRTLKNNKAKKVTSMVSAQNGYNTTPVDACYVGVVHPNTTFDLKALTGFVPVEKYAGGLKSGVMDFEVGKVDEVRFIETPQASIFAGEGAAGADVYATLIFGQNAYGNSRISGEAMKNIRKQLGSAGSADPLDQRSTIGWKSTFVTKILQQSFMGRIEHGTSSS